MALTVAILWDVETTPWDALTAPFAPSDLTWRVVRLAPDKLSAQVRPQLAAAVVRARLDAVLGVGGWSHSFVALGERGLACTLSVAGVHKSAAVAYTAQTGVADAAEDALAAAAAFFGLRPPVVLAELPWVDFDAEGGQILYEPDLTAGSGIASNTDLAADSEAEPGTEPAVAPTADAAPPTEGAEPATPLPAKSAGQQAIDKLVDRLKAEGKGLGAAKLLNTYGGYGSDPAAARELYARLRELLLARPAD